MEIIQGKCGQAISYAKKIDDNAKQQIARMCDYEFTKDSKIRIMPDVHAGMGCTIGTTMTITDKIVPNIVGVDIGCGMYTVQLKDRFINLVELDKAAYNVPSGQTVWDQPKEKFNLKDLYCYDQLVNKSWLKNSLGTLGGGNHFIEVDKASDGMLYLVIHSGSRNLGKQVALLYQEMAVDLNSENKLPYIKARQKLIDDYKAQGKRQQIQEGLQQLALNRKKISMPPDLCYVYSECLDQYLHDVKICQQFAKRNRELIAEILMKETRVEAANSFHTIHNYIDIQEMILRKGAIAAREGEKVLIPINMRDGSILGIGKGNPEWNFSAPHGAGRIMSRKEAKSQLSLAEYKETMKDVYTTSVNSETLDEAPMAYKSLDDIVDTLGESVEIIDILKPVYNFKASS